MTRTLPTFLGAKTAAGADTLLSMTGAGAPSTLTPTTFIVRDIQDNTAGGVDFSSGGAYGRSLGAFGGSGSPVSFNWSTFPGVTTVKVTLIGAGGYEGSSSATRGSGGGGGGASSVSNAVPVSHPESIDCWAGFLFGDSTAYFRNLSTATAAGGTPSPDAGTTGLGGAGGLASASIGDTKFNGGNGGVGLAGGAGGGGGGSAGGASAGGNAVGTVAGAAGAPYGGPGATNPDAGSSLNPLPGGGSSGDTANGFNHTDGGNNGYVRVEAFGQWNPTWESYNPPSGPAYHISLYVDTSDPSNTVEVRDNQSYVAGSWVADPNGVGVLVLGFVRCVDVLSAIDAGSSIIHATSGGARSYCTLVDTGGSTLVETFVGGSFGVTALEGDVAVVVVDVLKASAPTGINVATFYNKWSPARHDGGTAFLNVGHYYRQVYWAPAYFTGTEWSFRFDADLGADESQAQLLIFRGCAPLQFVANPAVDDGRWYTNTTKQTQAVVVFGDYTSTVSIKASSGSDLVLVSPETTDMVVAIVGQASASNIVQDPDIIPTTPYTGITLRASNVTNPWQIRTYTAAAPSVALSGIPQGDFGLVLNDVDNNDQWDTMCTAFVLRGKIVDPRVPYVVPGCSGTGLSLDDGGIDFAINQSSARVGDVVLVAFDVMSESVGTLTPTLPGSDGTLVLISTSRASRRTRYLYRFTAARLAWSLTVSGVGFGVGARCAYAWVTVADADRTDPIVSSAFDIDPQHGSDIDDPGVWSADVSGSASLATDLMVVVASLTSQPEESVGSVVPYRPSKSQAYPDLAPVFEQDNVYTVPYSGPVPAAGTLAAGAFVWPHPETVAGDLASDVALTMSSVVVRSMGTGGGGGGGGTPPTISAPSPSTTTSLTRFQPVTIDVADDVGLALVVVYASYAGQPHIWEIVHDNHSFGPSFTGGANQKLSVGTGYQLVLLRDGGWPGVPRIRVVAVNTSGQVASYDP